MRVLCMFCSIHLILFLKPKSAGAISYSPVNVHGSKKRMNKELSNRETGPHQGKFSFEGVQWVYYVDIGCVAALVWHV